MTEQVCPKNELAGSASVQLPPRRRLWVRVVLLLVIFASGGAVGTGVTLLVVRNRLLHAIHHPEEMPARIAATMRRPLGLTDQQVADIESILIRRQQNLQELRRRFQPQVERELDQVDQEISEVLDQRQRTRWQEHFQQLRSTWIPAVPSERRGSRSRASDPPVED